MYAEGLEKSFYEADVNAWKSRVLFDESFNGPFGGGAGVLMNGKRNFMTELHCNVLIESKSEFPDKMKQLFFKSIYEV